MTTSITEVAVDLLLVPATANSSGRPREKPTHHATLLVRIRTAGGCEGIGYVASRNRAQMAGLQAIARGLGDVLKGLDALSREVIRARLRQATLNLLYEGAAHLVIAAIDIALWDIVGKMANMPLHRMLGGFRTAVPTYAYVDPSYLNLSLNELADAAKELVDKGFKAIKGRVSGRVTADDIERIRVLREAVGPQTAVMVDGMWAMNAVQAIRLCRALEPYNLTWFEDPLPEDDFAGLARVRATETIPIAAGERLSNLSRVRDFLDADAVDHVILDIHHLGGATPWLKAVAMAMERGVPVSSHHSHELYLPFFAALPVGGYLEYQSDWEPLYVAAPPFKDGMLHASEKPGFGLELDEKALRRFAS